MKKNILKILILIGIILLFIIGTMYLIDLCRMKKGEEVVFGTWGAKYVPPLKTNQNKHENKSNHKNYQKYSKTIENLKIELGIPEEWKYEEVIESEENDTYKYILKLYKNSKEQCAMLYVYNAPYRFGVCGTGRTDENITLDNGQKASVGYYYDEQKEWSDISFYDINGMIAIINHGLTNTDAEAVLDFVKTINISEV